MNYTTLAQTIRAFAENDFPVTPGSSDMSSDAQVQTFIRLAEQRIYNSVELPATRDKTTLTAASSNRYLTMPTGWLATNELSVIASGSYYPLIVKDESFIRESFPNPSTTGQPQYYALVDETRCLLGPTPDSGYSLEIDYFRYPDSIVDASTSWLGDNFDQVLLYGSLLEAAAFQQIEADVLAQYQKRYDEGLALLKQLAEGKNRQDQFRTPPSRMQVA